MKIRDVLGVSERRQAQASRLMQLALVGFVFVGFYEGSLGVVVNAGIALLVTYVPALLQRDYEVSMDAAVVLWLTSAVFLHALGTVGLPGMERNFYQSVWWWDHVTHALSASVVAAAGYAAVRAIEVHREGIYFPPLFTFAFILLFVVAFGVFWEVIEFGLGRLAKLSGSGTILTQYGLGDSMLDLVFDLAGAVVTAVWGTAYLTDVTRTIQERLAASRQP